jgi:hypothetical protein
MDKKRGTDLQQRFVLMNGDIIEEDDADEEEDQGVQTSKDGEVEQVELTTQSDIGRAVLLDLVDWVVESIIQSRIEDGLLEADPVDDRHKSSVSSGSTKNRNATEVSVSKRLTAYQRQMEDRFNSADQPLSRLFSVKKSIFIRNRVESSQLAST